MRRFEDRHGRTWDVVVGRESFGSLLALFVPAAGNPEGNRQALLTAQSQQDAQAELDGLTQDDLDELLERSDPKRVE